jgi:serine/threonine protein kinase
MDELTVKVADFGLSVLMSSAQRNLAGTYYYLAPELLRGTGSHSTQSDVYAFGLMLWEFVTRKHAFLGYGRSAFEMHVVSGGGREAMPTRRELLQAGGFCPDHEPGKTAQWPDQLLELIADMWHDDPAQRPPMAPQKGCTSVVERLRAILFEMVLPDELMRRFWLEKVIGDGNIDRYKVSGEKHCLETLDSMLDFMGITEGDQRQRPLKFLRTLLVQTDSEGHDHRISMVRLGKIAATIGPLPTVGDPPSAVIFFNRLAQLLGLNYFYGSCASKTAVQFLAAERTNLRGRYIVRLSNSIVGCLVLTMLVTSDEDARRLSARHIDIHQDSRTGEYWIEGRERFHTLPALLEDAKDALDLGAPATRFWPFDFLFQTVIIDSLPYNVAYSSRGFIN